MYDVGLAYFFWFIGGFGTLGFHRFYMGRIGTGFLWFFTGGLAWIGALTDLFRMQELVDGANARAEYERALKDRAYRRVAERERKTGPAETLERKVLKAASNRAGMVTAAQVALEADVSVEEAQKELERLAAGGFCEMRIRETGAIIYRFAEFEISDGGPG
jgi:hypothetical protein